MQMGLGKTAQSISTLEFQRQLCNIPGPFLIVAPLTTLGHWQREVETWTSMVSHQSPAYHIMSANSTVVADDPDDCPGWLVG